MVRSRGELYDSDDLGGGVVFGERDSSPGQHGVKQVGLPSVRSPPRSRCAFTLSTMCHPQITFATSPFSTQTSEVDSSARNGTAAKFDELEMSDRQSVHKRAGFGTATV